MLCRLYHPLTARPHSWAVNFVGLVYSLKSVTPDRHLPVYAVLTELPAVFLLYDSSIWSGAFLILIFSVSVWNGGGFYIEVFGRKSVFSPAFL